MSDLPEGWTQACLGELANEPEQCVPAAEDSFAYVDIGAIDRTRKSIRSPQQMLGKYAPSRARKKIAAGDTLVSMTRPNLNAVALVPDALDGQIASTGFDVLCPKKGIDPRWLAYVVRTDQFIKAMSDLVQGALYPAVRSKDVRGYTAALAPTAEQTRIANQLDILLARIQACNDHLDAIPVLLSRFRQAALNAATSGMLTGGWRSEQVGLPSASELRQAVEADHLAVGGHARGNASAPTEEAHDLSIDQLPEGWEISTLQDCCVPGRPITYGILKPGPELDEGVPYIRVADFPGNRLNLNSIKKTTPEIDLQYKRARLVSGDLLLSIRGSVGRLIVIPPSLDGANITQDTARLSITPRLNARYVYYALLSPDTQRRMAKAIRGVAVRGINIGDVRALQLPLPSLPEQTEIVRQLDALLLLANQIEARWTAMRAYAQRLVPQLLTKAFRGELVKQDPQDEPANVLLRRLTEQPTTAATLRGRSRHKQSNTSAVVPAVRQDPALLSADAWAASGQPDEHATTAQLIAVLKAWGQPMPQDQARLAVVLCLQPRLFTAVLPAQDAAQWRRLVGAEAEPLPTSVAALQPAVNTHWRRALVGLRARGDVVVSGTSPQDTWALGPGADRVDTTGWPDGRAGWVATYLRAHGVEALLPLLSPAAVAFVHARAA